MADTGYEAYGGKLPDLGYFVDIQPDHGEGHVKFKEELEVNEWYCMVHMLDREGEPMQLTQIFEDGRICLERGLDRSYPFLTDLGVGPIHNGKFHKTNWLKRVEAPSEEAEEQKDE